MRNRNIMKNSKKNIHLREFIGKRITIIYSTDMNNLSTEGVVVDETRNLLEISQTNGNDCSDDQKLIKLPKKNIIFEFYENGQHYEIQGKDIVCAPEKRTKKLR